MGEIFKPNFSKEEEDMYKGVKDSPQVEDDTSTRDDNDGSSRNTSIDSAEGFVEEEDATSVILVSLDGKAYYAPHWHSEAGVDLEKLEAELVATVADEQPRPVVISGQARSYSPLEKQQCQSKRRDVRPSGSLPRSPSL